MGNKELYIPYGVKNRWEIMPGIGKEELTYIIFSAVIGIGAALILNIFGVGSLACGLTFLFIPIVTTSFVIKDKENTSLIDQVRFWIQFNNSQKTYAYHSRQTQCLLQK